MAGVNSLTAQMCDLAFLHLQQEPLGRLQLASSGKYCQCHDLASQGLQASMRDGSVWAVAAVVRHCCRIVHAAEKAHCRPQPCTSALLRPDVSVDV